jgi:hypothetical protein
VFEAATGNFFSIPGGPIYWPQLSPVHLAYPVLKDMKKRHRVNGACGALFSCNDMRLVSKALLHKGFTTYVIFDGVFVRTYGRPYKYASDMPEIVTVTSFMAAWGVGGVV